MASTHTQVWFGPDDRPLHGNLSLPDGARARGGVLLCPPMGEEGRASHRTFRRLAEALAEAGLAALRYDHDGTGDSAGAQDDPDRVAAWLGGVEAARGYLRDLGLERVSAVGMRLGATLAGCQASLGGGFDDLVLWDPCVSGRTFLREGEALYAFSEEVSGEGRSTVSAPAPDDGYRHTPGFQYDAPTARAMRGIDLAKLPLETSLADRLLLLVREDRPSPDSVVARVEADAGRSWVRPALDQDRLLDLLPSDNFVPARAIAATVAWLAEGAAEHPAQAVATPLGDRPVVLASGRTGSVPVRERVVRLGPSRLFGLVSEPVEPPAGDAPRPWVVLVNVAAEHHIGPGRRWVEYAREWAAMGYRCVRIDQSGIGDSPSHPGQQEDAIYADAWLDDGVEIVDALRADGSPVALLGLCSGGYSAFEAALRTRVEAVFTINPRVTLYGAGPGETWHSPRRRAARVVVRPVSRLAVRHRLVAGGIWRIYRQVALWHAPFPVLARVVRRGTVLRIVSCRMDAREFTEVAALRPWLWWLRRDRRFTLEVDDVFDHSLLTRHGQEAVRARATDFVRALHGDQAVAVPAPSTPSAPASPAPPAAPVAQPGRHRADLPPTAPDPTPDPAPATAPLTGGGAR